MKDMTETGIASLSESQRKCLRLVAQGIMSSKQISAVTGLSPATVDQYLYAAGKVLGTSDRGDAAKLFAQLERESSQSPSQLRTMAIADAPNSGSLRGVNDTRGWPALLKRFFGLPPLGGRENELSLARKLTESLRVAILIAALTVGLVLIIAGGLNTFR